MKCSDIIYTSVIYVDTCTTLLLTAYEVVYIIICIAH